MSAQIAGNAGVIADVDEARNVQIYQAIPGYPTAGGFYSVAGHTTAVVAAALAADTMLMSARLAAISTRKAYITRFRCMLQAVTANAAAVDPGVLGLMRFTLQTPTGGNARISSRMSATKGSATDITDIRDSNAALTGTVPTFGTVVSQSFVPVVQGTVAAGLSNVLALEWIVEFPAPLELVAGDGVCLRTMKAMPATCTWGYSYVMHWFER